MISVHNLYFLPPAFYYTSYCQADKVLFEACEHYQKRTCRNRYAINTSQGRLLLSIPLTKGKNEQCPVKDVRIAYDEDWTKTHLNTIRSAYGKTPYFAHFFSSFEMLLNRKERFLFDLQQAALEWSIKNIRLQISFDFTKEYICTYPDTVRDSREQSGQRVQLGHLEVPKPYPQPWQEKFGFTEHLSLLDTLFCCGPETLLYIKNNG